MKGNVRRRVFRRNIINPNDAPTVARKLARHIAAEESGDSRNQHASAHASVPVPVFGITVRTKLRFTSVKACCKLLGRRAFSSQIFNDSISL